MSTVPTFSVIIPTHNRASRVARAADSVLSQTDVDFELIIVDDGSRDATPGVLAALESDRCRTFRNPVAGGVSAARNRGAREARREFLLFLDDDDQLRPGALELFRGRLQANPGADFAWGGRRISEKDAGDRLVRVRRDVWSTGGGLVGGTAFLPFVLEIAASCAFTLRRRVFADLGGFDEQLRVGEDRDLFLRLAAGGYQGCCVADLVVDIDEHLRDSLSRTGDRTVGPASDLRIMDKHRAYLARPENAPFLDRYLLQVYAGFLLAGDEGAAREIAAGLRRRNAYDTRLLRMYLRHSTVFRTLKSALHYDAVRRVTGRARVAR